MTLRDWWRNSVANVNNNRVRAVIVAVVSINVEDEPTSRVVDDDVTLVCANDANRIGKH
jgi:hypothetical protein